MKFLQVLVEKGANPHANVEKLEFYRKLDVHKRHLTLIAETRNVQDAVMTDEQRATFTAVDAFAATTSMIDTTIAGIKFAQPKRREEVLAE